MKKQYAMLIKTHNEMAGFHYWEKAPVQVDFLKHNHRHIFVIKCLFSVAHGDRDIEILTQQQEIEDFLTSKHPPDMDLLRGLQFGRMSCELLAVEILDNFDRCIECEILEDGKGGAIVRR